MERVVDENCPRTFANIGADKIPPPLQLLGGGYHHGQHSDGKEVGGFSETNGVLTSTYDESDMN